MVSHEYKCIFIHIPKTAGTSILHKLRHFEQQKRGIQDHYTIRDIEPYSISDLRKITRKEQRPYILRKIKRNAKGHKPLSWDQYNSYFKFAFVRNPWARVYSWYKNVMRDDRHQAELGVAKACSFKEFLENHLNQWALRSQLFWITDSNGEIPLDFIGRFENLAKDFSYVCDVLQIEDKTLPKLLVSGNAHYAQFYDTEMRKIVARRYADEIEYFKFKFDDNQTPRNQTDTLSSGPSITIPTSNSLSQ